MFIEPSPKVLWRLSSHFDRTGLHILNSCKYDLFFLPGIFDVTRAVTSNLYGVKPYTNKIYPISSVLDPHFELQWVDMDVYIDTDMKSLTNMRDKLKKTLQGKVDASFIYSVSEYKTTYN